MTGLRLRPYRPGDRADVYDICVRTADAGGDTSGRHTDDDLPGDVYAGPYLEFAPDLCFVLDDGQRARGYVLGVADTAQFVDWWERVWLPAVAARRPPLAARIAGGNSTAPLDADRADDGTDDPDADDPDAALLTALAHPRAMLAPASARFPAHLHIDLAASARGAGHGRALIARFLTALHERGVPGVHLGVNPANTSALAFYRRLGFTRMAVARTGPTPVYLSRPTWPPPIP